MIRNLIPAILFSLLFLTALPAQEDLSWLRGQWRGVGYQVPTDTTWPIELSYDPQKERISIRYPSLKCGGNWQLVKRIEGGAEFIEWIDEGSEHCDNGVQIVVTSINEEYISVAYFLPDLYDGVVAHSVLRRQRV